MKKSFICALVTCAVLTGNVSAASDNVITTTVPPQQTVAGEMRESLNLPYTYVKCYYKADSKDDSNPSSSWEWARDGRDYFTIKGYWHKKIPHLTRDMFYTKATSAEIMDICVDTLKKNAINSSIVIPLASYTSLPYDFIIWHQGENQPVEKVGNRELDRMVIFGDSLSDTHNVYSELLKKMPNAQSWFAGHFTNGKVWHEYLSEALKLPGYVWAVGNAQSDTPSIFSGFDRQLDSFISYYKDTEGYNIEKTLFTVFFGGNDFIQAKKSPDAIIETYTEQLERLANLGAKQIAIFRLPDFSVIPDVSNWSPADKDTLKEKSIEFNEKLEKLITELSANFPQTRFYSLKLDQVFQSLLENSDKYGFVNTTEPCLNISDGQLDYFLYNPPTAECKSSNAAFIYWDRVHPSTKTHYLLAQLLKEEIEKGLE